MVIGLDSLAIGMAENMSDRSVAAMRFGSAFWVTLITSCASGRQPSVCGEALFRWR